jgi:hypothetical protein
MVVTTRERNKQAHPGAPDLASACSQSQRDLTGPNDKGSAHVPSDSVQQAIIDKVATFEKHLLTQDASDATNASKPPGPAVSKKLRRLSAAKAQALRQHKDRNSSSAYPFLVVFSLFC